MYNGSNLSAGSELVFDISGRANSSGASLIGETSWQNIAIGVGGLGVVLVVVGLWLYQRSKKAPMAAAEDEVIPEADELTAPEDAESLMDAIIALDDQYQSGELPEEAYHQRRAELKERLQNLKLE
jgi:cbb3-type cytochrome oxidase subunit 3